MKSLGLVRYDAMCTAIAGCSSVDEVMELRNKAKALEVYAAQALNFEAERECCKVRIRAERKAGELLKEMKETGARQKQGGDQKSKSGGTTLIAKATEMPAPPLQTLKDLGISRDHSSRWQQLADVPEEQFERAVTSNVGPKPSAEAIIYASKPKEPDAPPLRMDPVALWVWGRLRDFEADGVFKRSLPVLLSGMTEAMRADCLRIAPKLANWIGETCQK